MEMLPTSARQKEWRFTKKGIKMRTEQLITQRPKLLPFGEVGRGSEDLGGAFARALLAPYDSLSTWYDNPCEYFNLPEDDGNNGNGKGKSMSEKSTVNVKLYPNPNKAEFELLIENDEAEDFVGATLEVFDLSGRLIATKTINKIEKPSIKLNAQAGIYIYKVSGKTKQQVGKLIIID